MTSMLRVVCASANPDKVAEIAALLAGVVELLQAHDTDLVAAQRLDALHRGGDALHRGHDRHARSDSGGADVVAVVARTG